VGPRQVDALRHGDKRVNIPTAEMQSFFQREEDHAPRPPTAYPRARPLAEGETRPRDPDRDPQIVWNGVRITLTKEQREQLAETGEIEIGDAQLVWRGKDAQDWSDLIVNTPPLYIQEKIHPKAIIEDLRRQSAAGAAAKSDAPDLFADFNGVPREAAAEFYLHDQHWSNRMILGDSLSVMASLAERERLKGKVQCIYFDPPYGIKFNSNWQVSTQSPKVQDGKQADISREPEQVKAFRDTWKEGIHSYLTYLRDRLTVMRDLLTESGSIFVQIGDENVHRVRAVMEEVFGQDNFVSQINFVTTSSQTSRFLPPVTDIVLWFARSRDGLKYRQMLTPKDFEAQAASAFALFENDMIIDRVRTDKKGERLLVYDNITSRSATETSTRPVHLFGQRFFPKTGGWKTSISGIERLSRAARVGTRGSGIFYVRYFDDFPKVPINNFWRDTQSGGMGAETRQYVVQTNVPVIQRCILMATDPGDLVLDPTCGSGTTAYVAEQWGRRWVTIDTSRVALALARTRLMAARYPWYLLADSPEGRRKEAELTGRPPADAPTLNDIRQGFVYERVPHITLKSIANNSRIDDIWEKYQNTIAPLLRELRDLCGEKILATKEAIEEWEVPRDFPAGWPQAALPVHAKFWAARIARQKEIDDAIAKAADIELLYDRPYADGNRVRVSGPFTVESLSPHRIVAGDQGELADDAQAAAGRRSRADLTKPRVDFAQIVIDYLKRAGIHQSDKSGRINFDSVSPWPGHWVGAEGRFMEGEGDSAVMRRAAILIGPEYGTVSRPDLTAAAREANEARFDVLIACAFNFDAHSSELDRLGPLRILKARMNVDLHMAGELKNTGKGNLFVIFGEPDIDITTLESGDLKVKVNGIDVYDPNTGDIRSGDTRSIAAWFIDTDYNEESFFVRHAYFLGANDPYKSLKTALRAEIDEEAWATLYRAESRPFPRPTDGVIAVKVINHFGDEVMKVYRV
jgi:adenine-specific DNA-methyltransferase